MHQRPAFTLVELIVVVAIIGILAAVILVAIDPARRLNATRNARRATDVRMILDAMLRYEIDNNQEPSFLDSDPATVQVVGTCTSQPTCAGQTTASLCANITGGPAPQSGTWTSNISPAVDFVAAAVSNANLSDNAWAAQNDNTATYIRLDLGAAVASAFNTAKIWGAANSDSVWHIEYSDDNVNWGTAYSNWDMNAPTVLPSTVTFPEVGAHRYWRLRKATTGGGGGGPWYHELQFGAEGVEEYIKRSPYDPTTGTSVDTRYYMNRDSNDVIIVGACDEQGEGPGGTGTPPVIEISG